jgi:hypothetical protein
LRDAMIRGLAMLEQGCYQNKALFVMTDGMDNTSSITPSEMLAEVKKVNVQSSRSELAMKRHLRWLRAY